MHISRSKHLQKQVHALLIGGIWRQTGEGLKIYMYKEDGNSSFRAGFRGDKKNWFERM